MTEEIPAFSHLPVTTVWGWALLLASNFRRTYGVLPAAVMGSLMIPVFLFAGESSAVLQQPPSGAGKIDILVTSEGKPTAGAKVWVATWSDAKRGFSWDGPVLSNQIAIATFAISKEKASLALGRDESGQLDLIWLTSSPGQKADSVLNLKPASDVEATISHQGKPISGVKCKPFVLFKTDGPLKSTFFPELLSSGLTRSDAQGKVRFAGIPRGFGIGCEVVDERFAWSLTELTPSGKNGIELVEPGTLELLFEGVSETLPPTAIQWRLIPKDIDRRETTATNRFYLESDTFGEKFKPLRADRISQIAPGQYHLIVKNSKSSSCLFDEHMEVAIDANKNTSIKIAAKKGVIIQGRMIDAITGLGIPRYPFRLYSTHGYWDDPKAVFERKIKDVQEWVECETNENGDYEIRVQGKGRYGFEYSQLSNGSEIERYQLTPFDRPSFSYGVQANVPHSGRFVFPDLCLAPAFNLQGKIVDKQGQPWKESVELYCPVSRARREDSAVVRVANDGSFKLASLPPDASLIFRARSGKAVNVPTAIPPEQWKKNGFSVALDEANGVTFAGTVQDQSGRPVPRARVTFYWYFKHAGLLPGRYAKKQVEVLETDEQGKFALIGQWPGERYHLTIEREGYLWSGLPTTVRDQKLKYDLEIHNSLVSGPKNENLHIDDLKSGRPGETVDLGILRLIKNDNRIRGKVVDLDGKPISGIQVIAAADGRGELETTSNASGEFEIRQLIDGYGFLIAKGPAYRSTYISFHSGDAEASIVMRRKSDPALPPPAVPKGYLASREAMVRHVLESIWKSRESSGWGRTMLESMAEFDLARAQEWVDQCAEPEKAKWSAVLKNRLTGDPSGKAKFEEIFQAALDNVEDGIVAAKNWKPGDSYPLLRVGEKLLEQNKAACLRFAEEAVSVTRALPATENVWKISSLAWAGELVWLAGNQDGGRKLIQEGIDILLQDPKNPSFGRSCTSIAPRLAVIDWPEAKALLDRCPDPGEFNSGLSACILKIGRVDLPSARAKLSLFRELNGMIASSPSVCRLHLARLVAAKDPKLALSVLEDLPSMRAFQDMYAQGLVEVAMQIHPKDPEGAYLLVDKAFDYLDELNRKNKGRKGYRASCAVAGAILAHKVQNIGYPDPHSLIARTLSYLGGPPDERSATQKSKWKEAGYALAFTDPKLARKVVERHSTMKELADEWLASLRGGRGERHVGFMLAMIAPDEVVKAFDAAGAKGWTRERVSDAGLSEIFGSFTRPGDLMENIERWDNIWWFK